MRRLIIVLSALAVVVAVAASPALAQERMYGAESPVKYAAPWGFSGLDRLAPGASPTFSQLSSSARVPDRLTLAFGGGTNISTSEELPSGLPSGTVNAATHPHDVYWFYLETGARIKFYLDPATPSAQIQLRLFSPDAEDINVQSPIKTDASYVYPPNFDYTAPAEGYYSIDVYAVSGASNYTLDYDLWMAPNDDISVAVPITASPVSDWLDSVWDVDDVYRLPLRAGDRLSMGLTIIPAYSSTDIDLDLFLLGPASTSVWPKSEANSVAHSWNDAPAAESIVYTASTPGNYYIDVAAYQGWGVSNLTWSVSPVRPTIARSPSASKLSYKRKRGKAKFTLKAKMLNQFSLPVKSTKVYLQTSSNGRKWKNSYTLYTNASGWASKTITAKKKGTKYYRWYRPKTTTNTSAQTGAQRVVVK